MKKFFNKALRILLITNGLILLSGAMLGPIYAVFVRNVGGDFLDAGYAFATFAIVAGIVTLVSGKYSDRVKENEFILALGYFIMGVGFFSYTLVHSVFALLMVQVLIGIGEAIYVPSFDAIYSKHLDGHKTGREWGAWEALNYFSMAAGAILGGFLVAVFGFNIMFIIMGLLSIGSAAFIFFLPRKVL